MDITPQGFEKASDKLTQEQLNKPIDEVDAEPTVESVPEEAIEVKPEVETPEQVIPDKPEEETEEEKVPKSRFLTMHQRAVEAEKALRTFEAERANQPETKTPIADDEELYNFFKETFGDTELTEKLYKNELARLSSIEEKAAERAFERFSKMGAEQEAVINERVESFDRAFEELAITEGKTEFTDDEQVAMLDIVEQYSPKDTNGNLLGDYLLSLDKAYEIYQLRNETIKQPKREERNKVASIIGAKSNGTPSETSDADWQPGWQGQWRNKLGD